MARISYVNGRYLHHADASVHIEDRGYQFSDGVYEVMAFYNRRMLDEELHMKRLARSLKELRIAAPMSNTSMRLIIRELIACNNRNDGTVYIQISRGVARRDHPFPKQAHPSLIMAITGPKIPKAKEVNEGVAVITAPDLRWGRRDIKSISLLPNIMAKQEAAQTGAREAWLVGNDGYISEGSASNSVIINAKGELLTSPLGHNILGGVTRAVILDLARKAGIKVVEKSFTVKEAKAAKEAFILSTTSNVLPVKSVDGHKIGNGTPGAVTLKLLKLYYDHIFKQTGKQWS